MDHTEKTSERILQGSSTAYAVYRVLSDAKKSGNFSSREIEEFRKDAGKRLQEVANTKRSAKKSQDAAFSPSDTYESARGRSPPSREIVQRGQPLGIDTPSGIESYPLELMATTRGSRLAGTSSSHGKVRPPSYLSSSDRPNTRLAKRKADEAADADISIERAETSDAPFVGRMPNEQELREMNESFDSR